METQSPSISNDEQYVLDDDDYQTSVEIDINSIKNEEKYIIENLIEKLCSSGIISTSENADDIEMIAGKHFAFIKRRLNKYISMFSESLSKRHSSTSMINNTDQLNALNEFLYKIKNIFGECGRSQLLARSLAISSYIYIKPDIIQKCIDSVKLKNITEPLNEKNSPVTSYWLQFNTTPLIYFLGTRFDNTKLHKSDRFQLYTGDGSPVLYFFRNLTRKIEEIVNSDQFKRENPKAIVTKGNAISMDEYYENTKYININFDICGCKNPIILKFDNNETGATTSLGLLKKKIEETELISIMSLLQLKLYLINENLNGTIMAWSRISIAV